jgi:hypothetical protein
MTSKALKKEKYMYQVYQELEEARQLVSGDLDTRCQATTQSYRDYFQLVFDWEFTDELLDHFEKEVCSP